MIGPAQPGHHRTDGWIEVSFGVEPGFSRKVGGLHHHVWLMIALPAIHGANQGEPIEHRCLLRVILAEMNTRQLGRDILERAADFRRHLRFHIPRVNVRRTAGHPKQNHGFAAGQRITCGGGFGSKTEQAGQG
jgi:hypothetical protein